MGRKYELTDETKVIDGHILYRIRALKSLPYVQRGALGGFVESEENLSQEGTCWVYDHAMVYQNAKVKDDSRICDFAKVYGCS
jgi:hypothetical protein